MRPPCHCGHGVDEVTMARRPWRQHPPGHYIEVFLCSHAHLYDSSIHTSGHGLADRQIRIAVLSSPALKEKWRHFLHERRHFSSRLWARGEFGARNRPRTRWRSWPAARPLFAVPLFRASGTSFSETETARSDLEKTCAITLFSQVRSRQKPRDKFIVRIETHDKLIARFLHCILLY